MAKEEQRSCIDCSVINCVRMEGEFPSFCPSKQTVCGKDLEEVKAIYAEEENLKSMIAAAEVEMEGYCKLTRVQEIMEYAKKLGALKLGIATCAGTISESRMLAKIFRHHGFEVYGLSCKIGCLPKTAVGIPQACEDFSPNTCNPILQAKLLNEAKTDLNVVAGLCVGHDSLFYKYSDALVTTAFTKDRVLGHNAVAALYNANFYYKKKLFPED